MVLSSTRRRGGIGNVGGAGRVILAVAPGWLAGCSAAPAQNIMGSFFPAWLLCAAIGCGAAAGFRLVLGALAVHDHVIFPLLTYLATALAVAMLIWLIWFGH